MVRSNLPQIGEKDLMRQGEITRDNLAFLDTAGHHSAHCHFGPLSHSRTVNDHRSWPNIGAITNQGAAHDGGMTANCC